MGSERDKARRYYQERDGATVRSGRQGFIVFKKSTARDKIWLGWKKGVG